MSRYADLELRFWASLARAPKVFCSVSNDLLNAARLRGSLLAALLRAVDFRAVDLRAVVLRRVVGFLGAGIESGSSSRTDGCHAHANAFCLANATPVFVRRSRRVFARAVRTTLAARRSRAPTACHPRS